MLDDLALWSTAALIGALSLFTAGHALIMKRDPRSALGWIVVSLAVPLVGPFFYWCLGVNRISRRARTWLESGRRLTGAEHFRTVPGQDAAPPLPPGIEYMAQLRSLADRVTNGPLLEGNRVIPLENGDAAYPAMLEAIAGARSSIHLSTYIFDGDRAGRRFIAALADAARRGVAVRVIVDGLGEKYSLPRARVLMEGTRIRAVRFLPLRQGLYLNLRNHRKVLI
uniref:PLDc N-terminal domain-containing protein n=1 Tax=Geobacter sp. TaxID=46610 RepID=UPI002636FE1C